MAILTRDLSTLSKAELVAMVEAMASRQSRISFKVTEKGGLSMYGLGRFPVTLYRSQWERLLSEAPAIKDAILANADKLATKD